MSDQEILDKAIAEAISNGWTYDFTSKPQNYIYSHEFAKALWGEGHYNLIVGKGRKAFGSKEVLEDVTGESVLEAWQYHLREMVISPDPIKYIGDNI